MPHVRIATAGDIQAVAADMRTLDKEEVWASSGFTPEEALRFSLDASRITWCLEDDLGPVALFGVGHIEGAIGSPWYLANNRHDLHRAYFARRTHDVLYVMHQYYPQLHQIVDARHYDSIRWLLWAGFEIRGVLAAHGHERRPFIFFSKVKPDV